MHLPYYAPTDLFKTSLFGREDDASTPANGRYFVRGHTALQDSFGCGMHDWISIYQGGRCLVTLTNTGTRE